MLQCLLQKITVCRENYIYCETYDAKVVKDVIKDFKKCIKLK